MIYIVQNAAAILPAGLLGASILVLGRYGRADRSLMLAALLGATWLAAILAGALILAPVTAGSWTIALGTAFIIWVGFVAPAVALTVRAAGRPWRAALGEAGLWLLAMLAQAALLRAIGLTPPA